MSEKEQQKETVLRPTTIVAKKEPLVDEPKQGPAVDVNSDITPITRKPIVQVDASNWPKMNLMQLHQQLETLEQRYSYAQQVGHIEIMNQVNRGINDLKLLIHARSPDEIKLV